MIVCFQNKTCAIVTIIDQYMHAKEALKIAHILRKGEESGTQIMTIHQQKKKHKRILLINLWTNYLRGMCKKKNKALEL